MKVNKNIIGVLLLVVIIFTSCDRAKLPEYIGPALCASSKFVFTSPLSVSEANVDLKAGNKELITAKFNESLSWKLQIIGNSSGGIKSYSGNSNEVSIAWSGNSDLGLPFFTNETCVAKLSVACKEAVTTSFSIVASDFSKIGYLMQNFDGSGKSTFSNPPYGDNLDKPNSGIRNNPIVSSPQGGNYYRMVSKKDIVIPVWGFGGTSASFFKTSKISNDLTKTTALADVINDPSMLYYNIYINGNGSKNISVAFTFSESVNSTLTQRNYIVQVDWEGWKLVTFKLSDAGVLVPANLTALDISLGAGLSQGTYGDLAFDFPIITPGASFYDL